MTKPRLSAAINWRDYEAAIHRVFWEALARLVQFPRLCPAEPSITLELYWLAQKVHQEQFLNRECRFPFSIDPDATNKPQPDDPATAPRLKKRPDFACTMKDMLAPSPALLQISYYLECKRLGQPEGEFVFNDLYSKKGVARFMTDEHQYGKGCASAAMVAYVEDMPPDNVIDEVNTFAGGRNIPPLEKAAAGWATNGPTVLSQPPLRRSFETTTVQLHHFWIDLRHCQFDLPPGLPPQSAGNLLSPPVGGATTSQTLGFSQQPPRSRPAQRIAILGWGSLLWENDAAFDKQHEDWNADGPTIKVEYSRVSRNRRPGALTLVIDEKYGAPTVVRWSLSKRASVAEAGRDLRLREGANESGIKMLRLDEPHGQFLPGSVEASIAAWGEAHSLTGVVWTGLPSNFDQETGRPFSPQVAIEYLKALTARRRSKAKDYIRKTLPFVQTPVRVAFEKDPELMK